METATSNTQPHEGRRRVPAWLVFASALLVALVAAYLIAQLRNQADEGQQALLLFEDLEGKANRISALEWQAIAEQQLSSEVAEEAQEARDEMAGSLDELGRMEVGSEALPTVEQAFYAYEEAVDEEFRLLASGQFEEAEAVDEERVDPSFEELREALEEGSSVYSADALMARRTADLGSLLVLASATGLIGLLLWRFERSRRDAELLATERKVLRKSEELLRYQALHDPLTKLPNRVLLIDRLKHALDRIARKTGQIAVLFLDLDEFKVINDSLGHRVGDQLLISAGRRLQECLRPGDTLARFGGDEFTILLEDIADVDEATKVAERIAKELRTPFKLQDQEVFVNASIGIVSSALTKSSNPDDILRDADTAMYEAKKKKAGYEVFSPDMSFHPMKRLQLETDLHRAIREGEFRVHYQPLIELETNRISEVEALVRWEHPEHGLLLPAEFLSQAEETGLILEIDRFVLKQASRQVREWQERHPSEPPLVLGVNLSTKHFRQPNMVEEISQTLKETGLDPRTLKLEITESFAIENMDATESILRGLKDQGIRLAIDDFGTGYSSLFYLKRLPVDCLKIDRSFVEGLGHDPEAKALVRTTIELARALGLRVTGEGIETADQLAQLRELGCNRGQGYYFAHPLPSDAASTLLAEAPADSSGNRSRHDEQHRAGFKKP